MEALVTEEGFSDQRVEPGPRNIDRLLVIRRYINSNRMKRIEAHFPEAHFSFASWRVLKAVHDDGASTIKMLARSLGLTGGATSRLVYDLERQGLLVRNRSTTDDRRIVQVMLTDAGLSKYREKLPAVSSISDELFRYFDVDDAELLIELHEKLLVAFENMSGRQRAKKP